MRMKRNSTLLKAALYSIGIVWAIFCAPGCTATTARAETPEPPASQATEEMQLNRAAGYPAPNVNASAYAVHYPEKIVAYHSLEAFVNSLGTKAKEMEWAGLAGAAKAQRAYQLANEARRDSWQDFTVEEQELYYRYCRLKGG